MQTQTQDALKWLVQVTQDTSLLQTAAYAGGTSLPVLKVPQLPNETQRRLHEDVAIALSRAIQMPAGQIAVMQLCGRVALAEVLPTAIPDPVVPVLLINPGDRYQRAYGRFIRHMAAWHNGMLQAWRGWPNLAMFLPGLWHGRMWRKARRVVDELVQMAEGCGKLSEHEIVYFKRQLALCLASPERTARDV